MNHDLQARFKYVILHWQQEKKRVRTKRLEKANKIKTISSLSLSLSLDTCKTLVVVFVLSIQMTLMLLLIER